MSKVRFGLVTFLFVVLLSFHSSAQRDEEFEMMENETEEENEKKEVPSKIGMWNLNGYGAFQDSTILDTLHDYSHIYHPVFKKTLTSTYLGNYGTAGVDNNYFGRNYNSRFFFMHSREAYILTPQTIDYFNTTTPYTRMDFSQSENKSKNNETRFNVIHSQNVNPYLNFTFITRQEKSDGQYNYQETRNNYVGLYSSYNKDNLNIHGGVISNSIRGQENGGLTNDSLLNVGTDPEYWNTNLTNSQSKYGYTSYYTNAEYRLGKWLESSNEAEVDTFIPVMGIIYSFDYNRNKQEFFSEEGADNTFFDTTYYGDSYTTDKLRYNIISNVVQLKQYENQNKKYSFGKRAYLGHELHRGSMPGYQIDDTTHIRTDIKFSNVFVGGGIYRQTGRFWTWNFDGKIYLTGRNSGQFDLNGNISKPFTFWGDSTASVNFTGVIENRVADYFMENLKTNHYQWTNSFDMEQRVMVGGSFRVPKRKLEIGANYAVLNNFFYNNAEGIPDQTGEEFFIMSAYFDKDFNWRRFHLRTRVLWQKASSEKYIHLPDLSAFVSGFYQFTISKVLFTQLGFDTRYNTKYYADAYAPSTGLFYLQNEKEYGNYPYIDVYANLRLKRTRVFFKLVNIGTNFLSGEYITTPNYPMPRSTFRLGVSWAFYD